MTSLYKLKKYHKVASHLSSLCSPHIIISKNLGLGHRRLPRTQTHFLILGLEGLKCDLSKDVFTVWSQHLGRALCSKTESCRSNDVKIEVILK